MGFVDRVMRAAVGAGIARASTALLETTGARSGQPRVVPVTNGLDGDVFWIVTEHGRRASYVRNLTADPSVRVKVGGRWRAGVARVTDDDPQVRLAMIARANPRARMNVRVVQASATEMLVVRVDLDPVA